MEPARQPEVARQERAGLFEVLESDHGSRVVGFVYDARMDRPFMATTSGLAKREVAHALRLADGRLRREPVPVDEALAASGLTVK